MRITDVEAIILDTGKNYTDYMEEGESSGVRFVSLIKITTDEGMVGWSDIETQPHVGKAIIDFPSSGGIGFESLRSALIGEDPLERERLWQKMYRYLAYYGRQGAGMQMISGVDIALWDIAGKAFNVPVWKLLGAKYNDKIKAYASTLFRPNPDAMKRAVSHYLRHGFKAIKFGWGVFGLDLKKDMTLLKAARAEAGDDIDIMVDAGWYGVSLENVFRPRSQKDWSILISEMESLNIFWLEDFLHPENISGYADLSSRTSTLRIAIGE